MSCNKTIGQPCQCGACVAEELTAATEQIATLTAQLKESKMCHDDSACMVNAAREHIATIEAELTTARRECEHWKESQKTTQAKGELMLAECDAMRVALKLAEDWIAKSPGDGDCTATILGTISKALDGGESPDGK